MDNAKHDKSRFRSISKKERLDIVKRFQIIIPRFEDLTNRIAECHGTYDGVNEPEHIFISGATGVGKTTITKNYENRFPRIETDTDDIVKVLRIETPVPATCKELITELLDKLGDPKADVGRQNIGEKTRRLVRLLQACGTELIIIDEFQHFIHQRRSNALDEVSDWLKNLTNKILVPIVLIGLPDSELVILNNPQLKRRFSERYNLEAFKWDTIPSKKEFKSLLKEIDSCLPFEHEIGLCRGNMPLRFYDSSNGTIGHLIKLIRKSAKRAVINDAPTIYMETFADVWEQSVKPDIGEIDNPFSMAQNSTDADNEIREYRSPNVFYGENNRRRSNAKREPISHYLKRR